MTEDEMAGWHHWLNGRESEWTPGVGAGQGGLVWCDSWGRKESDTTERLNWIELSCWGFSFAFGHGLSLFFSGIQHSPVEGCSAASCNFGVLTGEVEHTSFYSAILEKMLRMEKAMHVWIQGIYGRYPYLPHNLAVNQTALKIMTLKMKQTNNNPLHVTYFVKGF